jgi:hypothetical protein
MRTLTKLVGAAVAALALAPAGAQAWAPAGAPVHPGVQLFTQGAQCTANFIYSDGSTTYIGQAAHCASKGGSTDTNGCTTPTYGTGTPVEIDGDDGSTYTGTIAYSSWQTMQSQGETDANACAYNDLELVAMPAGAVANTNPSVPFWGGPTGGVGGASAGGVVYTYGNSELRLGLSPLSPKLGPVVQVDPSGWEYTVYTVSPGIPGDSGSAFMSSSGQALGILSFLDVLPTPGGNGVGSLAKEIAYMHAHGGPGADVVDGTEAFSPIL